MYFGNTMLCCDWNRSRVLVCQSIRSRRKEKIEEQMMSQAQKMLNQLYQDEEKTKPRLDITKKELDALQTYIEKMNDPKEKKQLEK